MSYGIFWKCDACGKDEFYTHDPESGHNAFEFIGKGNLVSSGLNLGHGLFSHALCNECFSKFREFVKMEKS